MGLDIALVDGRGPEALLDDVVGRGEACLEVADGEFEPLRDVGGLVGRGLDAAGNHVVEQERRVRLHRLIDIDHMRQHLVIDFDERNGLLGDGGARRGDGGHGMALIERLLARHDVAGDVPEILRDPLRADIGELVVREVGGGDHRPDARQRLGLRGVDAPDARMGVGAAQHLADQLAGQPVIGAVLGAAGDFRHAVRTDGAGANPLELFRFGAHPQGLQNRGVTVPPMQAHPAAARKCGGAREG